MAFLGFGLIVGGLIMIGVAFGVSIRRMAGPNDKRPPPSRGFCLGLPLGIVMIWMGLACWHNLPDPSEGVHPDTDYTTNMGETE